MNLEAVDPSKIKGRFRQVITEILLQSACQTTVNDEYATSGSLGRRAVVFGNLPKDHLTSFYTRNIGNSH